MKSPLYKKLSFSLTILLVVVAVFAGGYYVGTTHVSLAGTTTTRTEHPSDFKTFWTVWDILDQKFPTADKVTAKDRMWGSISGLVASFGDPYTVFFNPDEAKQFNDSISGEFSGVGLEIGIKDGYLTVIAPIKDSPGYKAGIEEGDKILEIDGVKTHDMTVDKAITLIRGEKGTPVVLTIFRESEKVSRKVSLIRDTINVPAMETKQTGDVFTINFYSFSANSAAEFKKALKSFGASSATKLIVDLRGNPGGYLDAAVDIGSWFVPEGKPIVIEDFNDPSKERIYRSKGYTLPKQPKKIVLLVDGGSASASEILAGALKEYKIATLVGTKTYGKGSVQEVISAGDGSALKVTVAKWLTPNKVSISENGLMPDVEVQIPVDNKPGVDPQMDKALELLKK